MRYDNLLILLITSSIALSGIDGYLVTEKEPGDFYIDMDAGYASIKILPRDLIEKEMVFLDFLNTQNEPSDRVILKFSLKKKVKLWFSHLSKLHDD